MECYRRTKLLIRVGHALVNGILDVLDIVLNGDVRIIGCVVVGHYDDKVMISEILEEDVEQNIVVILLQLRLIIQLISSRKTLLFIYLSPSLNDIPVHPVHHSSGDERDRQETSS